jgi:hypothetical protein
MSRALNTRQLIFGCVLAAIVGWCLYSFALVGLEAKIHAKILFWFSGVVTVASAALEKARQTTGDSLNSGVIEEYTRRDLKIRLDGLLREMQVRRVLSFSVLLIAAFLGIVLESTARSITDNYHLIAGAGYALAAVGVLNVLVIRYEQYWLIDLAAEIKKAEIAAQSKASALQQLR